MPEVYMDAPKPGEVNGTNLCGNCGHARGRHAGSMGSSFCHVKYGSHGRCNCPKGVNWRVARFLGTPDEIVPEEDA